VKKGKEKKYKKKIADRETVVLYLAGGEEMYSFNLNDNVNS